MIKGKNLIVGMLILGLSGGVLFGCGSDNIGETQQEAYRKYGIVCMEKGEYQDALTAFQKALDQTTNSKVTERDLDISYYKAQTQYMMGDVDGAIKTYSTILDYKDIPRAYYLRACALFEKGDRKEAQADMKKASKYADDDYELYIAMYNTMVANDLEEDAKKNLENALDIKCKTGFEYIQKGRIFELSGDNKKAKECYETSIEEGEVRGNFYLAKLYTVQEEIEKADKFFNKYLESEEVNSQDLAEMGEMQIDLGNYAIAIKYFDRALKLESVTNTQQLMKDRIIAYEGLGNFEKAKKLMKKYLKDYTDDEKAKRDYVFLESRTE